MKNLFISDLHLGSPLFKSENEIIALLDESYDNIYIIGDIIDSWEDDVDRIVNEYKGLIDKINNLNNVRVIKGNHDPSIEKLQSIFSNCYVGNNDSFSDFIFSCIVVHGNEFDNLVTKYSWLAKLTFPIVWIGERFGFNIKACCRELFYSISSKRNKNYYTKLVSDIEKNLIKKYRSNYNYLVCGHTHLPKINRDLGVQYVNCGDWIHNRTYVVYDSGEFTLKGGIL